jgi:predicted nucleotidyltransferase
MRRSEIIEILKGHRAELAALGVDHLCLFGSVARDEASTDSDVDVVVDTLDGKPLGLFRLARIAETIESLLARKVDLISRRGLTHATTLAARVTPDLVDVF